MYMKIYGIFFCITFLTFTGYLFLVAKEDHKTCEVSRWKHVIGLIPAMISVIFHMKMHDMMDFAIILAFSVIFIGIGIAGVYGMADGFVLANMTLYFGSIAGNMGAGVVIIILVVAAFSFFFCHMAKCIVYKEKILKNVRGALIPHIFVGYIAVMLPVMLNAV